MVILVCQLENKIWIDAKILLKSENSGGRIQMGNEGNAGAAMFCFIKSKGIVAIFQHFNLPLATKAFLIRPFCTLCTLLPPHLWINSGL